MMAICHIHLLFGIVHPKVCCKYSVVFIQYSDDEPGISMMFDSGVFERLLTDDDDCIN